jgi:hypothetical protein
MEYVYVEVSVLIVSVIRFACLGLPVVFLPVRRSDIVCESECSVHTDRRHPSERAPRRSRANCASSNRWRLSRRSMPCPTHAGRVAVVLRGEAFRGSTLPKARFDERFVTSCNRTFSQLQLRAWASLRQHIVVPLEDACNVKVDVFASECSTGVCGLMHAFWELFSERNKRLVAVQTACKSASQGESLRESLSLFERRSEPSQYGFVVLARHDAVWAVPITHWTFNPSRFHFLSRCQLRCVSAGGNLTHGLGSDTTGLPDGFSDDPRSCHPSHGGTPSMCVHDIVHLIPGTSFRNFSRRVAGTHGCFPTDQTRNAADPLPGLHVMPPQRARLGGLMEGHQCYDAARAAMPEPPAFLLESWRPRSRFMREPTPLVSLIPLHDTQRAGHALPDMVQFLNLSLSALHVSMRRNDAVLC